ncbi:farnesyl pyrophosphate synthase-like isoform X2 [Oryza brachyantha]|uniref:Farnesyl pyrophosphate synthase n=1 Tax=Oryza brachyantha TaxID=4533 RepID=J3M277_ORYBR|nr:farnesyl pyrophosphate synthase-like isoform X2 [Oryza brachyantha]
MSMQVRPLSNNGDDGRSTGVEHELMEKLRLRGEASSVKCTRQEQRWQSDHGIADARERFMLAYGRLRDDLVGDDSCDLTDEARSWLAQMIDYNVPGGKLNRGLSVIDSYLLLKQGSEVTEDDFFLACVLGWCVEWFQACALLLDDIMDDSYTRRDQICWYRRPEVGLRGINDGILLKCHILILIKKYFREKPYFLDLLELWNEIALQTSLGQMLDLIGTHTGADDLAKYSIQGYRRIVKYKTAYYSFYLPVANALLLSGAKLEHFNGLKDILIEMGIYFQIQDDYLDCFADPNTIGKMGTDIEDHKCSWLIVEALGHANSNQIEVLHKNYGKKDSRSVSEVKRTYAALDLKDIFSEFERRCYNHLVTSIEDQKDRAAREILKSFLKKIHQRKK